MTSEARVPAIEITGPMGTVMKFAARKMLGEVPHSLGVMWNNPRVLMAMMGVSRKSEKWDTLDKSLGGLANMAAAAAVGCSFCLDLNYFLACDRGLDERKAREVPRWRKSDVFTPLEHRVMEYADAMCQTPVVVTDELAAALLDELGAAALLELTARIAIMNMSARANIALGIRSQGLAASCGMPPLAAAATTADVGSTA